MSKKNPHNLNWREAEFIYLYNVLCGTEMKLLSKIGVKLVNDKIIGKKFGSKFNINYFKHSEDRNITAG